MVSLLSSFMEDHCRLNTSTADIGNAFSTADSTRLQQTSELRHSQRINRHFTSVLSKTQHHAPVTAHQALRSLASTLSIIHLAPFTAHQALRSLASTLLLRRETRERSRLNLFISHSTSAPLFFAQHLCEFRLRHHSPLHHAPLF